MPGATITVNHAKGSGAGKLLLAEGLLLTLTDPRAEYAHRERALRSAAAMLGGEFESLREGYVPPEAFKAVTRALAESIEGGVKSLREAPIRDAPQQERGPAEPPGQGKAKGRGGKPTKEPKAPGANNQQFEQQHPRGRGGVWIKKGAGTGAEGPSPQVAHLQKRLLQLGYGPGAADGQFGDLTERALSNFQAAYGLQPTGQVDPATLATLQNPPPEALAQAQAQNRAAAALPNAQGQLPSSVTAGGAGGGVAAARSASTGGSGAAPPAATTGGLPNTTTSGPGSGVGGLNVSDPNSVRQFQASHGLTVDGIAGPETLGAAKALSAAPGAGAGTGASHAGTRSQGSRSRRTQGSSSSKTYSLGRGVGGRADPGVKTIQQGLETLGYDVGGTDGRFGPNTQKAVKKLQRKYGLVPDGVVGKKTGKLLERLLKRQAKPPAKGTVTSGDQIVAANVTDDPRVAEVRVLVEACERSGDVEGYVRARAALMALQEGVLDRFKHLHDRSGKFTGKGAVEPSGFVRAHSPTPSRDHGPITSTSHVHPSRPKFTPEQVAKMSGQEADRYVRNAREHVDNLEFQREGNRHGDVSSQHVESARHWANLVETAAHTAHERERKSGTQTTTAQHGQVPSASQAKDRARARMGMKANTRTRKGVGLTAAREVETVDLLARLEEATQARLDATTSMQVVEARAREEAIALMIDEAISAESRKANATVVKNGKPMFPIPPGDKKHAKAALILLGRTNKLSGAEKDRVRKKAKATLAEAELVESLDDSDHRLIEAIVWAHPPDWDLTEAADSLAKASTPEPFSTSKTSNWVARGGGLPAYIQHIAHDIAEKRGKSVSQAIAIAIGVVKRWARGGGKVDENTRAAARKALGEWEALKAKAHAS